MGLLYLKPSEIYYSQDRISAHFGRSTDHAFRRIGLTLDDLCEGRLKITDIPTIKVTKKGDDGKWYTLDNRRLWIFRHLQGAGKCTTIPCEETEYLGYLYAHKFSSTNGGVSVTFIWSGDPEGEWHKRITPADPPPDTPTPVVNEESDEVDTVTDTLTNLLL